MALCAVCGALLDSCSTANVSATADPMFDSSQIAPLNLTASSTGDGGWQMDIVSRGPQLDEAVVVYVDGVTETAQLAGATEYTLTGDHSGPVACVMVKLRKDDYWYPDSARSGDYWYFDSAGALMPDSVGQQWYSMQGAR